MGWLRGIVLAILGRYGERLRFPVLLALTAACFALDLFLPDPLPFLDEIGLALVTLLFATWRRPADAGSEDVDPAVPRDR